jgi:hypothetical protein
MQIDSLDIPSQPEYNLDDITDLLFICLSNNERLALRWMFGYNTALGDTPVNLVRDGRLKELYDYLHFNAYGPY